MNLKDVLLLGNDLVIPRTAGDAEVRRIAIRILEELVEPMKEWNVDDTEHACLKAIVFFNPGMLWEIGQLFIAFGWLFFGKGGISRSHNKFWWKQLIWKQ